MVGGKDKMTPELLAQAENIWKMLDEMKESKPGVNFFIKMVFITLGI